jgi:hypothetical protein
VRVELDVFSGRPNPTWLLSTHQERELRRRLGRLAPGGAPAPITLGYRGFLVYAGYGWGRPWLRIGFGLVVVLGGPGRGFYRDTEGIESWLAGQATRHGFGALLPQVEPNDDDGEA